MSKYNWFWLDGNEWRPYSAAHSEILSHAHSMGSRSCHITLENGDRYKIHLTIPYAQEREGAIRSLRKVKKEELTGQSQPAADNSNPGSSESTNSTNTAASASSQGSKSVVPENRQQPPLSGPPRAGFGFKPPNSSPYSPNGQFGGPQQVKSHVPSYFPNDGSNRVVPSINPSNYTPTEFNYYETVPQGTTNTADLASIILTELQTGARQSRFTSLLTTFCMDHCAQYTEDEFLELINSSLHRASSGPYVTTDGNLHLLKDNSCVQFELWKKPLVLINKSDVAVSFTVLDHADSDDYAFFSCASQKIGPVQRVNSKGHTVTEEKTRFVSKGEIPANSSITLEIGVVFLNKRLILEEDHQWSKNEFHFERLVRIQVAPVLKSQPISMATRQAPEQFLFVAVMLEAKQQPKPEITYWQPSPSEYLKMGAIGHGSFGFVYHAEVRGFPCAMKQWILVHSNKTLSNSKVASARSELKLLSSFQHRHVIPFIGGVDTKYGAMPCIFAFMKSGSMDLKKRCHDTSDPLQPELAFSFALQVARGLQYMHSKNYTHRDIKPGNVVLIDDIAVLVDVGEAKELTNQQNSGLVGTLEYMAPEIFATEMKITPAIDIFSFGVMLWELCERKVPRNRNYTDLWPRSVLEKGETPSLSEEFAKKYPLVRQLYQECVAKDPSSRPDASKLVSLLESIVFEYPYQTRLGRKQHPKASSSSPGPSQFHFK